MRRLRSDHPRLAVGAILAASPALSLGDVLIAQQGASFLLWQIFVMRSLIAVPFLAYLVRLENCAITLKPARLRWTLLRSLILVSSWILYFAALPHVEFATAAAAFYTLPLFIALLAALFLGEAMGGRGWLALALGFGGALLLLQPLRGGFDIWALLPILAAIAYAGAMTLTRGKCREEQPLLLALWLNLGFVAVGALALAALKLWPPPPALVESSPFLFGAWKPMWLDEWRFMAMLAAALAVGSIGAAYAYQNAPAPTVAIFDFAYVAFAAIWNLLLFAEMLSPLAAAGIVSIAAAGLISIRGRSVEPDID